MQCHQRGMKKIFKIRIIRTIKPSKSSSGMPAVSQKSVELKQGNIQDSNISIACIQESSLRSSTHQTPYRGFTPISLSREERRDGRVATLIHNSLPIINNTSDIQDEMEYMSTIVQLGKDFKITVVTYIYFLQSSFL